MFTSPPAFSVDAALLDAPVSASEDHVQGQIEMSAQNGGPPREFDYTFQPLPGGASVCAARDVTGRSGQRLAEEFVRAGRYRQPLSLRMLAAAEAADGPLDAALYRSKAAGRNQVAA